MADRIRRYVPFGQRIAGLLVFCLAGAPVMAQDDTSAPAPAEEAAKPAAPAPDPGFILWSDNSVSLLPWGTGFAVDPEEQSTFTFEHAHESRIGDLFLFVDYNEFHGDGGGSTWYGEIGPRFSFGKMLGKDLSHTFFEKSLFEIKDVLLAMQYERGEDPNVAEAFLLGIGFNLDVREAGILGGLGKFNYVQLNFYGRHEMAAGAPGGFSDMQVTMVASYPMHAGNQDFLLDGYFDWVVGFGDEDWSYHLNPQLTWDAGKAMFGTPGKFLVGIEVDWWWNKYQIPDSPGFDTDQSAVSLLFKLHL